MHVLKLLMTRPAVGSGLGWVGGGSTQPQPEPRRQAYLPYIRKQPKKLTNPHPGLCKKKHHRLLARFNWYSLNFKPVVVENFHFCKGQYMRWRSLQQYHRQRYNSLSHLPSSPRLPLTTFTTAPPLHLSSEIKVFPHFFDGSMHSLAELRIAH